MTSDRAIPIAVVTGLLVLVITGAFLVSRTPGTLVNEPSGRLGPTPGAEDDTVIVHVAEGDGAATIADKLVAANVIESGQLFEVLTTLMSVGDHLAAGDYEFHHGETALSAVERISQGITASQVTNIREGLRSEEVGDLLAQEGVVTAEAFRNALGEQYEASFLSQLPPGVGLEGFLFPATYGFPRGASAHDIVQRMLTAFDERYADEIQPRLAQQPAGLSLFEVVTLASIVEREAQVATERPVIASVFLNRLAEGSPLQADPTVQYAIASDPASVTAYGYWKRDLTVADLAVDSPYNTYVYAGMPPGPIASPGLASILAVLEPADTDYLYFVARQDGSHAFAATLEEHNRNVCEIDPARPECG